MKTAIIGASGFIGSHLLLKQRSRHPDCIGTSSRHGQADLIAYDLRSPDIEPLRLVETGHEAVVIAAGQTGIDACQRDPDAHLINVLGTLDLIRQLGRQGMYVVYLSTDNVFDGKVGGYSDGSHPTPPTAYGRHKWEVEREIGNLCERYAVVRLSKTFGLRKGDGTLLDEMAAKLAGGETISAAYDLIFNPTWVQDVVEAIVAIQDLNLRGVINVANPESWSRYDLGVAVAEALGVHGDRVQRISLAELEDTKGRPLNTSLRCDRLQHELDFNFTSVQECVVRAVNHWLNDVS